MKVKLSRFDAAEYLTTPEHIEAYLEEAAATGDPAFIAGALGDVARAQNFSQLSRDTGISLPGLRKALSGSGNPTLDTIMKVARALDIGMRFTVAPKAVRISGRAAGAAPNKASASVRQDLSPIRAKRRA